MKQSQSSAMQFFLLKSALKHPGSSWEDLQNRPETAPPCHRHCKSQPNLGACSSWFGWAELAFQYPTSSSVESSGDIHVHWATLASFQDRAGTNPHSRLPLKGILLSTLTCLRELAAWEWAELSTLQFSSRTDYTGTVQDYKSVMPRWNPSFIR